MYAEAIIVLVVGSMAVLLAPAVVLGGSIRDKAKKDSKSGQP